MLASQVVLNRMSCKLSLHFKLINFWLNWFREVHRFHGLLPMEARQPTCTSTVLVGHISQVGSSLTLKLNIQHRLMMGIEDFWLIYPRKEALVNAMRWSIHYKIPEIFEGYCISSPIYFDTISSLTKIAKYFCSVNTKFSMDKHVTIVQRRCFTLQRCVM